MGIHKKVTTAQCKVEQKFFPPPLSQSYFLRVVGRCRDLLLFYLIPQRFKYILVLLHIIISAVLRVYMLQLKEEKTRHNLESSKSICPFKKVLFLYSLIETECLYKISNTCFLLASRKIGVHVHF